MKIIIKIDDKSLETLCVINYCKKNNIEVEKVGCGIKIENDTIVVGDLNFLKQFIKLPTPNYYPDFCKHFLHRNVWKTSNFPIGQKVFIKPADIPKRFDGFITRGNYYKKKKPPYWCSDVLTFTNEYRLYINNSKIVSCNWYSGDNNANILNIPNINIPNYWCGSLDFGIDCNKNVVLIEAGEPISTGWYGTIKDGDIYAEWLIAGWNYLKSYNLI